MHVPAVHDRSHIWECESCRNRQKEEGTEHVKEGQVAHGVPAAQGHCCPQLIGLLVKKTSHKFQVCFGCTYERTICLFEYACAGFCSQTALLYRLNTHVCQDVSRCCS